MLEFRPITLQDKPVLHSFFYHADGYGAEDSFVTLFLWGDQKVAFFENEPALYAFLKWRPSVVTSLVEEAHQAVGGRAKMYFLSLLPHSGSWLFGVDLKAITGLCEGALVCSYDCGTQKMEADVRESQRDFAGGSKLLLGMRCFTPEYADGAALIDKVRAARRMGVEDFRFYNYGLIPQSHLDWIREALQ